MDEQTQFLQWLMEQTHVTQVELAGRLGISASLVSRLVRGERRLTLSMLRHVADVFGLPQTDVFTRAGVLRQPLLTTESVACADAGMLRGPVQEGEDEASLLRMQLDALRDPRKALAWSLDGKVPRRTIEKLARLVALELEYHDTPKEG